MQKNKTKRLNLANWQKQIKYLRIINVGYFD
jgi:hypothetical protein